MKLELIIRN